MLPFCIVEEDVMKKFVKFLLMLTVVLLLTACDICLFYDTPVEEEGWTISVNKSSNCCFAGSYEVTEYTDHMEIVIPDEYDGVPITQLGGYFGRGVPTPFYILMQEVMNAPEGSDYSGIFGSHLSNFDLKDKYTIEYVPFTLKIGKNISKIEYVDMDIYYPHMNEDGTITFYHPVIYIECSEENLHFYSKDGKLYDKNTDELVPDFIYMVDVDREDVLNNFQFSLTWDVHGTSSYDSKTGRLVKTTNATHPEDYVTTMFLSDEAMIEIYTLLMMIDISSYPDSFDPFNAPDAETKIESEPSQTIILELRCGDFEKKITCSNVVMEASAYNEKADAFVDAYRRIIELITETEEWLNLPEYEVFYK